MDGAQTPRGGLLPDTQAQVGSPSAFMVGKLQCYLLPWAALPFQNLVQAPLSPKAPPGSIAPWQSLSRPSEPRTRDPWRREGPDLSL